jgi:hypothetical protein
MGRGEQTAKAAGEAQKLARPEFHNELGMIFGAAYASPAVIPDGTKLPAVANPVADYVPCARPGSRAPHLWLERDGRRLSTHDLIDFRYTVFAGPRGEAWRDGAREAGKALGIPIEGHTVGDGADLRDPAQRFTAQYGIESDGAVLVRPDGHVAWRRFSGAADPRRELQSALHTVLHGGELHS